jgi:hypothetical protein
VHGFVASVNADPIVVVAAVAVVRHSLLQVPGHAMAIKPPLASQVNMSAKIPQSDLVSTQPKLFSSFSADMAVAGSD